MFFKRNTLERRAADTLHYLAAKRKVVTAEQFARLLGLPVSDDRIECIRRVINILRILGIQDLLSSRPRRAALVVQAQGEMARLPFRFFWEVELTRLAGRRSKHRTILADVFVYPYQLSLSQDQRRNIDMILGVDNGTLHPSGRPRRYRPIATHSSLGGISASNDLKNMSDELVYRRRAVLEIVTSEILERMAPWSREEAIDAVVYMLRSHKSTPSDIVETLDYLIKAGRLMETTDGFLDIPFETNAQPTASLIHSSDAVLTW